MATTTIYATIVVRLADLSLTNIDKRREKDKNSLIKQKMSEKKRKWFLIGKLVHKYESENEAIQALKNEEDFFGSRWWIIDNFGRDLQVWLSSLKVLALATTTGTVQVTEQDYKLLTRYATEE